MDIMYNSFVSTEKCAEVTGLNKYELSVLVAKRAKELSSGAVALVNKGSKRPLVVAMEEIVSGKLDIAELDARLVASLESILCKSNADAQDRSNNLEAFQKSMRQISDIDADRLLSEFKGKFDGIMTEDLMSAKEISSLSYSSEEMEDSENDENLN